MKKRGTGARLWGGRRKDPNLRERRPLGEVGQKLSRHGGKVAEK